MKKKNVLIIGLGIFSLLGLSSVTKMHSRLNQQATKQKFITLGMGIGVIKQNTINWYFEGYHDWTYQPGFTFKIPTINNGLIVLDNSTIGVINHDKIDFYASNHTSRWDKIPNIIFNLPTGYKAVITLSSSIGVLVGNQINFYDFSQNEWKLIPDKTFSLSSPSLHLITKMGEVGVVGNGKITFYTFTQNQWQLSEDETFTIPTNNTGLIIVHNSIGIVQGKKINFFDYQNNQWVINPYSSFDIPQ